MDKKTRNRIRRLEGALWAARDWLYSEIVANDPNDPNRQLKRMERLVQRIDRCIVEESEQDRE